MDSSASALLAWITSEGGGLAAPLACKEVPKYGLSIVADGPFGSKQGETSAVSIPLHCVMSFSRARAWLQERPSLASLLGPCCSMPAILLSIFLAWERQQGQLSFYAAYINALPGSLDTALFFTPLLDGLDEEGSAAGSAGGAGGRRHNGGSKLTAEAALTELAGTPLQHAALPMRRALKAFFNKLAEQLAAVGGEGHAASAAAGGSISSQPCPPPPSGELLLWAYSMFTSRAMQVPCQPAMTTAATATLTTTTTTTAFPGSVAAGGPLRAGVGGSDTTTAAAIFGRKGDAGSSFAAPSQRFEAAMVPLGDIFNHRPEAASRFILRQGMAGTPAAGAAPLDPRAAPAAPAPSASATPPLLHVLLSGSIGAGQQAWISYGHKANDTLLPYYGFCIDGLESHGERTRKETRAVSDNAGTSTPASPSPFNRADTVSLALVRKTARAAQNSAERDKTYSSSLRLRVLGAGERLQEQGPLQELLQHSSLLGQPSSSSSAFLSYHQLLAGAADMPAFLASGGAATGAATVASAAGAAEQNAGGSVAKEKVGSERAAAAGIDALAAAGEDGAIKRMRLLDSSSAAVTPSGNSLQLSAEKKGEEEEEEEELVAAVEVSACDLPCSLITAWLKAAHGEGDSLVRDSGSSDCDSDSDNDSDRNGEDWLAELTRIAEHEAAAHAAGGKASPSPFSATSSEAHRRDPRTHAEDDDSEASCSTEIGGRRYCLLREQQLDPRITLLARRYGETALLAVIASVVREGEDLLESLLHRQQHRQQQEQDAAAVCEEDGAAAGGAGATSSAVSAAAAHPLVLLCRTYREGLAEALRRCVQALQRECLQEL